VRWVTAAANPDDVLLVARSASGFHTGRPGRARGAVTPVAAGDVVALTFRVTAPDPAALAVATAQVAIVPERIKPPRRVTGAALRVPVVGVRADEVAVTAEPDEVRIAVTRSLHVRAIPPRISWVEEEGKASVVLRGAGVESLARGAGPSASLAGDGHTVPVSTVIHQPRYGQAEFDVDPDKAPDAGDFKGSVALGSGESPTRIGVELNARVTLWFAIFLVFAGVFFGQFLPLLWQSFKRRRALRSDLNDAVKQYVAARRSSTRSRDSGMDRRIGAWTWASTPDLDSDDWVRLLRRDIEDTRQDDGLDALEPYVTRLSSDVTSWVTLERLARDLDDTPAGVPARRLGGRSFGHTPAEMHMSRVIELVRAAQPLDPVEVESRLRAAERARELRPLVLKLWNEHAKLDGMELLDPRDRTLRKRNELTALWDRTRPPIAEWTDQLYGEMAGLLRSAATVVADLEARARPLPLPAPQSVATAALMAREADRTSATDDTSAEGRDLRSVPKNVWRWLRRVVRLRRWMASVDWLTTLSTMVVTSALFVIVFYDDTWGSDVQLVEAFGAGFVGRVAIDWARVHVFKSPRKQPRIVAFAGPELGAGGASGPPTPGRPGGQRPGRHAPSTSARQRRPATGLDKTTSRRNGTTPRGANRQAVMRAVREHPGATAQEIAAASGVNVRSVWPLLRTLTKEGDVHVTNGSRRPRRYTPSEEASGSGQ
jgi:hypothetical protein